MSYLYSGYNINPQRTVFHAALSALAVVYYVTQIKPILVFEGLSLWQCYQLFGPEVCTRKFLFLYPLLILVTKECNSYQTLWTQVKPYLIAVPSILFAAWLFMLVWAGRLYSEFQLVSC